MSKHHPKAMFVSPRPSKAEPPSWWITPAASGLPTLEDDADIEECLPMADVDPLGYLIFQMALRNHKRMRADAKCPDELTGPGAEYLTKWEKTILSVGQQGVFFRWQLLVGFALGHVVVCPDNPDRLAFTDDNGLCAGIGEFRKIGTQVYAKALVVTEEVRAEIDARKQEMIDIK